MNAVPASMSSNGPPTQSSRSPSTPTTPTPPSGHAPCLDTSDRNNNATPPRPPNPAQTLQNRPPIPRSPPVGARPLKDLPPGAAPIGSVIRPPVSNAVPLLASQLGHRPVNLDRGQNHAATLASLALGGNLPPLSPHHLNILSHTLSPFAAIPTGNGKIMARNINGTCKSIFFYLFVEFCRTLIFSRGYFLGIVRCQRNSSHIIVNVVLSQYFAYLFGHFLAYFLEFVIAKRVKKVPKNTIAYKM